MAGEMLGGAWSGRCRVLLVPLLLLAGCGGAEPPGGPVVIQCPFGVDRGEIWEGVQAEVLFRDRHGLELALTGVHAAKGWRRYPVPVIPDPAATGRQMQAIQAAVEAWNTAAGPETRVLAVDTRPAPAAPAALYDDLADELSVIRLDRDWDRTAKPMAVIGTTIWDNEPNDPGRILRADVVLNATYYLVDDALALASEGRSDVTSGEAGRQEPEIVDLTTLLIHELGHFLGLSHRPLSGFNGRSVMVPAIYIGAGSVNREIGDVDAAVLRSIVAFGDGGK